MDAPVSIYNSLTRKKEPFKPLNPPYVGMYVCGPTVYGDAHLGHARSALTFDLIYRYLSHLGYKVRYVRNITDVGHLENDADEGEDKIGKKARLEQLEPMEVVQHYMNNYHADLDRLNVKRPNIEPRASGHIPEQIEMIRKIIENGFAYEVNGSVYFDVERYNRDHNYGELSGRVLDDLIAGAGEERRTLEGQAEKRFPADFALWKKASPEHIMRWQSPWGEGFPGWHIECSAMSSKYLGETFDIHGGGMDLLFPHHECEIAQSQACNNRIPAVYWLHNNMITINGQKMGKSLGNSINLREFFNGDHPLLNKPYEPMTIRFFIMQAHYRSTLDFSNEALEAADKGLKRLMNGLLTLRSLEYRENSASQDENLDLECRKLCEECYDAMNNDFNSAVSIAALFNILKKINLFKSGQLLPESLHPETYTLLSNTYQLFLQDILGLSEEKISENQNKEELLGIILEAYKKARTNKDYATVDTIRAQLKAQGIVIKDSKITSEWAYEE